jgi:hypothetical protein
MGIIKNHRLVPDPSMSDAEYYAQRAANPTKPNLGRVLVEENAKTRIGGLALVRRRLNHHEKAAEWFKNAYEALYGGLAPAIDMSKVRVDTSIIAHDSGMVSRLDHGKALQDTIAALGRPATDRIISCVVFGDPAGILAPVGPSGKPSGRAIEAEVNALLDALDHVAELRGWKSRQKVA